jgi:Domain of unknown function (DUF1993)
MTVAMYTVSIPVVIQHLNGLNTVLDKAAAWAAARKVNEADLLNMRLSPSMFNLTRQVRTALQGCRERSSIQRTQSQKPDGRNSMHYKPKSIGALHIALGGLPGHMRIEVEPGVAVSAKTVGELRKATSWPEDLVITTPQGYYAESVVKVSKASIATHYPPRR